MTRVTLAELCTAVAQTLAPAVKYVRNFDEMPEQIVDLPMLEVYPDENRGVSKGSATDRITFGGGVRIKDYVLIGNVYAVQRRSIGKDNLVLIPLLDDLEDILEAQNDSPYFGHAAIKTYRYSWKRVIHKFGEKDLYLGARFLFYLEVF